MARARFHPCSLTMTEEIRQAGDKKRDHDQADDNLSRRQRSLLRQIEEPGGSVIPTQEAHEEHAGSRGR